MKRLRFAISAGSALVLAATATAQGQDRIPPGQMPPAGMCRIWINGVPPGRQPRATDCATARRNAPANSRIIYGGDSQGRIDPRYPNGTIDPRYPNGTIDPRYPNGTVDPRYPNGTIDPRYPTSSNGTYDPRYPNSRSGSYDPRYPNGTYDPRTDRREDRYLTADQLRRRREWLVSQRERERESEKARREREKQWKKNHKNGDRDDDHDRDHDGRLGRREG